MYIFITYLIKSYVVFLARCNSYAKPLTPFCLNACQSLIMIKLYDDLFILKKRHTWRCWVSKHYVWIQLYFKGTQISIWLRRF